MASKKTTRRRPALVLTAEIARQWSDRQADISAGLLDPLDNYTHIEHAAAKILGRSDGWRELNLSGLTTLSPAAAKALVKYSGSLVLNGIRKVDPEIARILASRRQNITLLEGLEILEDRRLAKMLAASGEENGDVYLRRLRKLSHDAAKVLAKADCSLVFGGHAKFSEQVNTFLSRNELGVHLFGHKHLQLKHVFGLGAGGKPHDGELSFPDVSQLDADAAAELARYRGSSIRFGALQEISPAAAKALSEFHGILDLRELNAISPDAALALDKGRAETRLQGYSNEASDASLIVRLSDNGTYKLGDVRQLTPELAATLSPAPILEFRNLKKLTVAAARVLAEKHKGSLLLDGLESLPNSVAAALSGHDGSVSLRGLSHISLAAAQSLASIRGSLSLGGLKKLGPRLAIVLADLPGSLMLDGVEELSPGVARRLQKHTGMLSMNGLSEISIETAKILAEKPNQKRLVRCGGSVAAVQNLLEKDAGRVTMKFQLNSHGAFQ
jgi:hypothetical protein